MIGKAVSLSHKKYNVIVLAGGAGSRMGIASDYIPKALTRLGHTRAIDHIIERYSHIAHKFVIGVGYHSDLLMSYVSGRYNLNIEYSLESPENLKNNCYSTLYCLDHADSRYGTIVTFCDLIMLDNLIIEDDSIFFVTDKTKGSPGTFRHSVLQETSEPRIVNNDHPMRRGNGLLGAFIFSDTPLLKSIIYRGYDQLNDFTEDVLVEYMKKKTVSPKECTAVYEFGTDEDLSKVRELWQNV
jgi:NDP-sugar pyrophosphorylase family protein